ncbi:MAG: GNAT family N-acetyltransferase [Actinobacteria bacterium]|nr:GNAT family N-acetyltransferase [Actinomycetota bacterium]
MGLVVEPARAHDAEQILELQYLCYRTEAELYDDYAIPPLTQTLGSLLGEYDTHQVLAARLKDEVVGSVRGRLDEGTCHIGRLIVNPRLQRRGLGTRLMRAIEEHFATAERYELFTGHLSEVNLRLYRGLGYTEFRKETASPQLVYLEKFRINS